jgi:RNA polymerase sigma-70 factor (ECF subfamily)
MSMDDTKAGWVRAALRDHEGPLLRYAASITGDPDRARDLVQDTFLKLCAEEPARLDGHLAAWLFTVCRHRALDAQRQELRMTTLENIPTAETASAEPSPAAHAARRDDLARADRWLAALPANQQEVVRLKFQGGLSYREIADITKLSVTNVGFLIHTALKTLRQRMNASEPA